ncbi:MAG: zinc-dependent metalloprotease [Candidatus Nanopelagicales bacterium]
MSTSLTGPAGAQHSMVDWNLAARIGARVARPGPSVGTEAVRNVVEELRRFAVEARAHVRGYTGLDAPAADAPVAVVDRAAWVRANADGFRTLLAPVEDRILARRREKKGDRAPARVVAAIGSTVTAAEVGGLLGWMSSKVLGQYELLPLPGNGVSRLLLVAPNIVAVEQALGVDPQDFRLWVCLHEETHRVQFTAVPWLRDHLVSEVTELLVSLDLQSEEMVSRLRDAVGALGAAVRGAPGPSIADAIQTPEQRVAIDRLTAVMALLEGHADHVMDGVGPAVIPTVGTIRTQFQRRRNSPSPADAFLRRLLGLDAKLRQYKEGKRFVDAAVDAVGMAGFNRVWQQASHLPTPEEIADPDRWVARVGRADV